MGILSDFYEVSNIIGHLRTPFIGKSLAGLLIPQ